MNSLADPWKAEKAGLPAVFSTFAPQLFRLAALHPPTGTW